MTQIPATLIRGDGIGPEIVDAVLAVLEPLGNPFAFTEESAGLGALEAHGDPLPEATLASIRQTKLALKGPLTTPVGSGFRSVNVRLREAFSLYANVRPCRTIVPGRFSDVDLVVVRENLEGLYVGQEHWIRIEDDPYAVGVATGFNTRASCRRIVEYAFDYAVKHGRRTVTVVHKANILKVLTGVFLQEARAVAKAYDGRVALDERIVDACAMQLVQDPSRYDVIVTTNLFGDILSDLVAGLVGGLGFAPGANIGKDAAIFEAVHGSAPDIAGQGKANPVALMLAAGLMLDHVGRDDDAQRLRAAIAATISGGTRTADIGGTASTSDFGKAVAQAIRAGS
ncbi:isocitrate/isopropylmalate dehydrogenase family protein [Roseospira marina]|uniref:Isocitrate/isopropylmalate dehydrogenase family protein n=1 Tax=Roseospira marina TaxID=140057 RepID=A0A5M6I8A3_9PROT|nr:isocitrate/isopropylmalate dehydrogenase family protein [Roseospira marina]KAA5604476.1 isocitrate/isopropylmalate dehydrogenase family protein [Roseospira marina]MBB4315523.1 isocitrate dehydrogenase (NAD+) [Roseospira marina]MBB5088540.1 isocitrate dehydrogenase (NAD+) [Roseospira marina]